MKKKETFWGWVFSAPYVINLSVFFLFPLIFSIYLTFTRYDLFNPPKWIGTANWYNLFTDAAFWKGLRNLAFFALLDVPIQTVVALVVAHILNNIKRGAKIFRVLYFIPVVSPWVGVSLMWLWLYNPQFGVFNWLLGLIGIGPYKWVSSTSWVVVVGCIAVVNAWKGFGYSMVLFLAGLQNISSEVIESADIDGANSFRKFVSIIVPYVSPTTFMVMILSTISAFQSFDAFYVMLTSMGGIAAIPDDFNVVNVLIYNNAFMYSKMGYASTLAWALFAVIGALSLIQNKLEKRWVQYD